MIQIINNISQKLNKEFFSIIRLLIEIIEQGLIVLCRVYKNGCKTQSPAQFSCVENTRALHNALFPFVEPERGFCIAQILCIANIRLHMRNMMDSYFVQSQQKYGLCT
ncbi:hypothetical protein pb186bvf_010591, partial [Paramecium bursaria]